MPLKVYLFRHGETEWSRSGQHTSRTDLPLTDRGETAARSLAARLSGLNFNHVFTSPRQRARRTCELAGLGAKAIVAPELAEWDYGDFEGLRTVVIRETRPEWNLFQDGCPQGESPGQIGARVDRFITRVRQLEGLVALFSHGHLGRVLAARWIGLPVPEGQRFQLDTAAMSLLTFEHDHPGAPVIAMWNAGLGGAAA